MTPDQLRNLIQQLHELICWLEETRPGSLDIALVSSTMVCCKDELLQLLRESAR